MKHKYFNENMFDWILLKLKGGKVEEGILLLEDYMKEYPEDTYAKVTYADTILKVGKVEEAQRIIDSITEADLRVKEEHLKPDIAMVKIKLYINSGEYEKAINEVYLNREEFLRKNFVYSGIVAFCKKNLNILNGDDLKREEYLFKQIYNYSEDLFFEHMERHEYEEDSFFEGVRFDKDFPLKEIYIKLRSMLPREDKKIDGYFDNKYVFKYDNCGLCEGNKTNYFLVVALSNTNEIITMYPFRNPEKTYIIDMTPEIEYVPQKRLSQIDKFNQRYNKNIDKK